MADDPTTPTTETPAPESSAPPPGNASGNQGGQGERSFSQQEVDRLIADRLSRERTAAADKLAKAQTEAEAAKLKEQGEWKAASERAEARVKELEAEVAARDHAELKRKVAARHKLPDALALRLVGATEEELDVDAKELAKVATVQDERRPAGGNGPNPRPSGGANADAEAVYQAMRQNPRYTGL